MDFLLDFILHIDQYMVMIVRDYHAWTYAILFSIIFCETGLVVTPFLPGDSLLFVAGAISALPDMPISVHILVIILFAAAVLGDYMIGHFFGRKLFNNPNSRIFKQSYLEKTHEFYKKYGGKTIILARFVPIVRTFAPFVAGMGKMNYYYFMMYNLVGGALWVAVFWLFLRRPSVCAGKPEITDCSHHIYLCIACHYRGSTCQTKILKTANYNLYSFVTNINREEKNNLKFLHL